jgi:hypothetical protein
MHLTTLFRDLEQMLLHDRHLLALHSGVPFVLLVYSPKEERLCREMQAELMEKLRTRDIPVIEHRLDTLIFDYYSQPRYEKRGGLQRIFDLERSNPDELRRQISGMYETELVERVLKTASRAEPDGAIFITRTATMYPFARVSNLLTALENRIRLPLVIFYPGSFHDGQLSFLNLEPHTGYRARIIA